MLVFSAERAIRTLRLFLSRIHSTGERDLAKALKAATDSYNGSEHTLTKTTPNDAGNPDYFAQVYNNMERYRNGFLDRYLMGYDKLNKEFALGQAVRYRLPRLPFQKESEEHFSADLYEISRYVNSEPVKGYKLKDRTTGVELIGSFLGNQLIKA